VNKKVVLMILDGWGIATNPKVSAIDAAKTPFIDSLYQAYPHSKLEASGLAVGLPEGQMGNSEVGHMNFRAGSGSISKLGSRINKAVQENTLGQEPKLAKAFEYAKSNNKSVHFIGLVSDGGVHAHIEHVKSLLTSASEAGLPNVFVHAFTDGREQDSKSGMGFMTDLYQHTQQTGTQIASVTGRLFCNGSG
jgi:2,3-bisphosphoglycerate-independent phosphoglycerate mutase